ncbi:MAG: ATP-binding protein [Magnetococcus sp. YQC-3]
MGFILQQLKNITFTRKLYYLIGLLLFKLFLILGAVSLVAWLAQLEEANNQEVYRLNTRAWEMMTRLQELNAQVNQYLLRHEQSNRTWVERHLSSVLKDFTLLAQEHLVSRQSMSVHLLDDLRVYVGMIETLLQQDERYGVNQNLGLQGEMRLAVHRVEQLLDNHPQWSLQLLSIRRAEKDFMLRLEEVYVVTLHQRVNILLAEVQASEQPERWEVAQRLLDYQDKFQDLAALDLSMQKGIKSMHVLWDDMAADLSALRAETEQAGEQEHIRYREAIQRLAILLIIAIALVLGVTGYLLSIIFHGTILKPIQKLTEQAHGIAHGDYDCDISLSGRDEIGVLARHLQQMKEALQRANRTLERKVEHRTQMLTQANSDLKRSLEQLEKTRDELVQSEKAASLGRLVAGFAHEINTPIGIGVGSISALPEYVDRLETLLAADEVDGDQLDEVMGKIREMSSLCFTNLRQVSDLVARFKRTSVDQSSEQPRRFNVRELLLDVQSTLHHLFKRSSVEIAIDCPAEMTVLSQPGALGQVMTNLLLNSLKHGFAEGTQAGSITINVQLETKHDKLLVIWFADNGRGMGPGVLKHIFEPFFTTAKGRGGSGLGLYICHNIVRNQLLGKIVCTSIPGQMTSFLLEIPVSEGR